MSPIKRLHNYRNQGFKTGVASITVRRSNPFMEFVLPISKARVCWAIVLILRENISFRSYIKCSTELETENTTRPLWVPCASKSVGKQWSYRHPHSPCHTHYIIQKHTQPAALNNLPSWTLYQFNVKIGVGVEGREQVLDKEEEQCITM